MFNNNSKKIYSFSPLVIYELVFVLSLLLINNLYANTGHDNFVAEEYLEDEGSHIGDNGQACPKLRKIPPAPERFKNKISPLRKEPRNLKKGKVLYRLKARKACKYCHGMEGKGDGSMADLAENPPRNFTCKEYMNKVTDGELFWVIKEGLSEGGMPSYKHLSDKKVWQLIQYIRTFSS